tara:strand:+ start:1517 stop:1741 length:225 start_codon:yes stop_codon:yes gene_type:complete
MFDYIQYGILPLFIQVYIQRLGMEHPAARLIKNIKTPEVIFTKQPLSFSQLYFLFCNSNGEVFGIYRENGWESI